MMTDVGHITSFIQLSINFSVYLFFILTAFKDKFRYRPLVHCSIVISYALISTFVVMLFMLQGSPLPEYQFLVLILWLICTVLVAALVLRSSLLQLLFMIFVVLDIQFNIMKISETAYQLDFIPRVFVNNDLQVLFINLIVLLAFIPAMWYLFIMLFKKVINMNIEKIYWRYLFFLPITSYFYCIFNSMNYSLKAGSDLVVALFILMLLNIFSFMSYVAVLQMLIKTNESMVATQTASIMHQQLTIQSEQYKKLTDNLHQTERLRHDMRHHFITLKGYVENQDLKGAEDYLDACIGKELPKAESTVCENHAVDMILRYYIATAKEVGAEVRVSVNLPGELKISDTDLCVIFGNLVENAVESCRRQTSGKKFIDIKAKPVQGDMLAIIVVNSYSGEITQSGDVFISKKHDGVGIGTYSIKSITERNGGNCRFSFKDNVFKASVLLVP